MNSNSSLVSTHWLVEHLSDPNLILLDCSMKKTAAGEPIAHNGIYIPGAKRFDYDETICDQSCSLPHMMPTEEQFTQQARELGINHDSTVVVYDTAGVFASPRAWWMLKVMGHAKVHLLDGGLSKWLKEGHPTVKRLSDTPKVGDVTACFDPSLVHAVEVMLQVMDDPKQQIVDVRSKGRFWGEEPEPRVGLRGGHIPGSINIPFDTLLNGDCYLTVGKLQDCFDKAGVNRDLDSIFSCGSGVTACIALFAAHLCGYHKLALFDGSWAQWGASDSLPIFNRKL